MRRLWQRWPSRMEVVSTSCSRSVLPALKPSSWMNSETSSRIRFLFHGLTLPTRTGKPIRVAPHLLRHVLATHARTVQKIPAEAVAYLLHHRVVLADSTRTLTISEATAYYSRLTMEQLLALLFEAQSQFSSSPTISYLQTPSPRPLP